MDSGPVLTSLADPRGAEARMLLQALSEEIGVREDDDVAPVSITGPQGIFVLASLGDRAVGCGGVRQLSGDLGEIRGLYVLPESRGMGVGRAILLHLQSRALQLCYRTLRLESGAGAAAAARLCESFGFERVAPDRDDRQVIRFEKRLGGMRISAISDYTISNYVA